MHRPLRLTLLVALPAALALAADGKPPAMDELQVGRASCRERV